MPTLVTPFQLNTQTHIPEEHVSQCGLIRSLPAPLQESCRKNIHLTEYLHSLPLDTVGVPQYYPKLTRNLQDIKQRNLVYPVAENVLIHVLSTGEERDYYIPIEPSTTLQVDELVAKTEERLLDFTHEFADVETEEERKAAFLQCLDSICVAQVDGENGKKGKFPFSSLFKGRGNGHITMSPRELAAVRYLILRNKVGLGVLQPIMHDPYVEDISCSGVGHIFIEHKIFRSLKSAIAFTSMEELDDFALQLSERINKPVTVRKPVVDAVLSDGSRINIVYGREISQRGTNFTIRKFSDTPLSILELIEFGTMDYLMAAYLSVVLEEGMNMFVVGETASGKTTLMNALTTFIPPTAKVVSIEDTPELQVPHKNWIREVSRGTGQSDTGPQVGMFDLLKAALRQRPNFIIIGEIRGEEGNIAFQAMQTGHAVMTTFHASSVEKVIQRLTGHPINVPKTYMDNLNVVVIQSAVKLPNGSIGRRTVSINEIVGYDPQSGSFSFIEVFRWDPSRDIFEFVGNKNSYLLEQKIALKRGIPPNKKGLIYSLLERRARVLERLHKEMKVTNFYELLRVLATAQRQGLF